MTAASTLGVTQGTVPVVAPTQSPAVTAAAARLRPTPRFVRIGGIVAAAFVLIAESYAMVNRRRAATREVPTVALIRRMPAGTDTTALYFSQGVTDELFVALARLPQIRLLARESAREFSNDSTDLRDAARRLGVAYLVELRPRVQGSTVRINADLVRASEGTVAWSATFDRDLKDPGALQRDIAKQTILSGPVSSREATEQDIRRWLECFAAGIARDSLFAAPNAAAATAWNQLADAFVPSPDGYPKSDSLARRAPELDETNAEAHANVGYAAAVLRWDGKGRDVSCFARSSSIRAIHGCTTGARSISRLGVTCRNGSMMRKATQVEPTDRHAHHLPRDVRPTGRGGRRVRRMEAALVRRLFGSTHICGHCCRSHDTDGRWRACTSMTSRSRNSHIRLRRRAARA